MTKTSFLTGFFLTFLIGIPLAFYNPLIAWFIAVFLGSFVAASKKGGGFIGFALSYLIIISPYVIPTIIDYLNGELTLLNLALLIIPAFIDIRVIYFAISGMVLGIIAGWLSIKLSEKFEKGAAEAPSKQVELREFDLSELNI